MKTAAAAAGAIIIAGTGWFYKRADGKEATRKMIVVTMTLVVKTG
jgi:hypothetical protein